MFKVLDQLTMNLDFMYDYIGNTKMEYHVLTDAVAVHIFPQEIETQFTEEYKKMIFPLFRKDVDYSKHLCDPWIIRPTLLKMEGPSELQYHVDHSRDTVINILLQEEPDASDAYFSYEILSDELVLQKDFSGNRIDIKYPIGVPCLFDTQISHGVTVHHGLRLLLSVNLGLSFRKFENCYNAWIRRQI